MILDTPWLTVCMLLIGLNTVSSSISLIGSHWVLAGVMEGQRLKDYILSQIASISAMLYLASQVQLEYPS